MLKVWQAGLRPLSRPFPDLPSGSGDFQALRLLTTVRLQARGKTWLLEMPLGGAPASVPSAGTSKPIKLMIFA